MLLGINVTLFINSNGNGFGHRLQIDRQAGRQAGIQPNHSLWHWPLVVGDGLVASEAVIAQVRRSRYKRHRSNGKSGACQRRRVQPPRFRKAKFNYRRVLRQFEQVPDSTQKK